MIKEKDLLDKMTKIQRFIVEVVIKKDDEYAKEAARVRLMCVSGTYSVREL